MDKKFFIVPIIVAIIMATALSGGLWFVGTGIEKSRDIKSVTVTGSVKKAVTSDLAKWTVGFSRRAQPDTLKQTYTQTQGDVAKIKKYITSKGIIEKGITTLPLQTDAVYEQLPNYAQSQNITGYVVREEMRIESDNIDAIEKLANDAVTLVDQGIILDFQRTEYFYTKLDELRPTLFADATKNAQERANAIAQGTGTHVGTLTSARTGVIQILSPNSTDVSDYGSYDLSTREKEISATVNVSFALEK